MNKKSDLDRRTIQIVVRMNQAEREQLRRIAEKTGEAEAELIRRLVEKEGGIRLL